MHTCIQTYKYTQKNIHTYIHTCIHTYIDTWTHTHTRKHTNTQTHTYTQIRTHTHTHTHSLSLSLSLCLSLSLSLSLSPFAHTHSHSRASRTYKHTDKHVQIGQTNNMLTKDKQTYRQACYHSYFPPGTAHEGGWFHASVSPRWGFRKTEEVGRFPSSWIEFCEDRARDIKKNFYCCEGTLNSKVP